MNINDLHQPLNSFIFPHNVPIGIPLFIRHYIQNLITFRSRCRYFIKKFILISKLGNSTDNLFGSTRQHLARLLLKPHQQFLILTVLKKRINFNSDLINILLKLYNLLECLICNLTGFKNLLAPHKKFNTVVYCDLLVFLRYDFE